MASTSTSSQTPTTDTTLSVAPSGTRSWSRGWLSVPVLALALTGAYLAGPARTLADSGTTVLLLLHLGIGLLIAPVLLWVTVRSWRSAIFSSGSWAWHAVARVALLACVLTGIGMIVTAARGGTVSHLVMGAHIAAGFGGAALFLLTLAGSSQSGAVASHQSVRRTPEPRVLGAVMVLLLGLIATAAATPGRRTLDIAYQPDTYYRQLTATTADQAANPLFPAGVTVTAEPGSQLRSASYCGTPDCHPDAYSSWLGSAHQKAALNAAYTRLVNDFEHERGQQARRWCDGCHAPGTVLGDSPDLGPYRTRPASHRDLQQQEGVSCITCHSAAGQPDLTGNGRMKLRFSPGYLFAEHPDARLHWLHGFLIRVRPGPHRHSFSKPWLHRRSEACAPCHRTSYNLPQNEYKFLRTADDYATWQSGPHSGESIHGFYPPAAAQQCQDCHDPHRGGAPPTRALAGIGDSPTQAPGLQVRRESATPPVTVDLFALRRRTRLDTAPEELVAPLDRSAPRLQPGEAVTLDVVVRNRSVGHQFPAGTGDLRGAWLEVQVADASGRLLLGSQRRPARPPSEAPRPQPGDHVYGMVALDREGRRLAEGQLWRMVTPLYHRSILPNQPDLDRRSIQPGESDVARYRLRVPPDSGGSLRLSARLWQGYLSPQVQEWESQSRPDRRSRVIAESAIVLPVAGSSHPSRHSYSLETKAAAVESRSARQPGLSVPGMADPALPERFYDYGVGLLLQGDLPRAQRAMRRVQDWAPKDVRGYLGLGRVYLTEGDLLAARAQFERALSLVSGDPQARAFLALVKRRSGQYDQALADLEPLLHDYPRDRRLWFEFGMGHSLAGRYDAAAAAFERLLGIDPDDLSAHYNLMRSLQAMRKLPEARREEVIYQLLREDDAAKRIGLSYLRRHPWADREARTVHEHPLFTVVRQP